MNRKEKLALLNGLLKGEKSMSCIFDEWPEKTYYAESADADYFTTQNGKTVSIEEVDHELMNYPEVRLIYKEPENELKISYFHKYVDENGEVIENGASGENTVESNFSCPVKLKTGEQI